MTARALADDRQGRLLDLDTGAPLVRLPSPAPESGVRVVDVPVYETVPGQYMRADGLFDERGRMTGPAALLPGAGLFSGAGHIVGDYAIVRARLEAWSARHEARLERQWEDRYGAPRQRNARAPGRRPATTPTGEKRCSRCHRNAARPPLEGRKSRSGEPRWRWCEECERKWREVAEREKAGL